MEKQKIKEACIGIAKNPIILGILAGLIVGLLGIEFPTIINKTVNSVAQMATPLALITIGAGFEGRKALAKIKPTIAASLIKLVIQPLIFLPVAVWMGFGGEKMIAILIMLASPTTPSCYIMAKSMNNDGVLTASVIVTTTLLAAFTLTGWIFYLKISRVDWINKIIAFPSEMGYSFLKEKIPWFLGGRYGYNRQKIICKSAAEEGVDTIFGYPGGTVTDLFDELYKQDSIDVVLPRHEQGLIHAAEGYAKSTGKVGVCLVTSGPGATNIITGLADAHYDSIPLVCFTGQVPLSLIGNDAFQEVDIVGMTRSVTKYGVTVRRREDLGRIIKMAFYIASTGKPGPVLIDIPKDIQTAAGPAEYPSNIQIRGYKPNESVHIGQLKKAYKLLRTAKKPLILAGGGINIAHANDKLLALAEKMQIPVVTTIMGKGAIPTSHPLYVGNSGMHGKYAANMAVSKCDVLFSIGTRFNDRITGDLNEFAPKAKIVHIDVDTASISRNVVVDVPVVSDANLALEKLLEWAESKDTEQWQKEIAEWDKKIRLRCAGTVA